MIRKIEELSMNAWPSLSTDLYDGWVLRASNGYTKRANSINLLYPSVLKLEDKINYCKSYYESLNLPIVYKITDMIELRPLDLKLQELAYQKIDETSVRLLDLESYKESRNDIVEIAYTFSQDWYEGYTKTANINSQKDKSTLKSMLKKIKGKVIYVTYKLDNQTLAFGFGVLDQGYVGLFDIFVEKSSRGNGYSKVIMHAIISEAIKQGARKAYLQVVIGNVAGENLYNKLGFNEIYRYWYRRL